MKTTKAFTLIEILVVATIIVLLTVGGIVSYNQFGKQSRDARRKADVEQVRAALEMYKSNNVDSSYPDEAAGLTILVTDGYLKSLPVDPKTNETFIDYTPTCASGVCTTYTLTGDLESGGTYEADPLGATIVTTAPTGGGANPTSTPTAAQGGVTPPTATPTSMTPPTATPTTSQWEIPPTATPIQGKEVPSPTPTSKIGLQ